MAWAAQYLKLPGYGQELVLRGFLQELWRRQAADQPCQRAEVGERLAPLLANAPGLPKLNCRFSVNPELHYYEFRFLES